MGKPQAGGFVIWINGHHRVGKTSVARELVQLLGENHTLVLDYNDIQNNPRHPAADAEGREAYNQQVKQAMIDHIVREPTNPKTVICLGKLALCLQVTTGEKQPANKTLSIQSTSKTIPTTRESQCMATNRPSRWPTVPSEPYT